ncbi:MAG: HK97 family phage prohead protease [Deltaproteobacteria bacterium]|nr:MAG: HK97 family phage prohead protease [Deltaproteobacteria bacterium]
MKAEKRYLDLEIDEIRSDADAMIVSGFALKYNKPSKLIYGEFVEYIDKRALDGVNLDNTFLLFNHNTDHVLGNTKSGTLQLTNTADGLRFRAELPDTQRARETYTLIKRGDVSGMSFAFTTKADTWNTNVSPAERTIHSIGNLSEISIVPVPAYPDTEVSARALNFLHECKECKSIHLAEAKQILKEVTK